MSTLKRFITILAVAFLAFSLSSCKSLNSESNMKRHEVKDVVEYVVDAGTVTEVDYDYVSGKYNSGFDLIGGCSAIAKQTNDGKMLVGRNMDLYYSNNPAYIVRTDTEGCYKTIGVAYVFSGSWPTYEQVLAEGLSEDQYKFLPFYTTDIMNSEGLYVEINMRSAELWTNGESKFACSGTNESAAERVNTQCLGRYIADHCADVDEAIEYVNSLNLYTGNTKDSWNYCFILADASGHYGLLEIADNRVIWHDYQPCQTNFYIDEKLAAKEELKCGLGRYDYLMSHINSVQSESDMHNLMDAVSYFSMYSPDCLYDNTSEFVGTYPWWTNEYMEKEENKEEINATISALCELVGAYDLQTLRNRGTSWLSVFTTVANCTDKTLHVRFFEDESKVAVLTF